MLVECMILTIVEGIVTLSTPRFIKLLLLIVLLCCLPADCKLLLSVANGGTTTSSLALDVSAVKDASMIAASSSIWFLCFGGGIMFLAIVPVCVCRNKNVNVKDAVLVVSVRMSKH